MTIAAYSRSTKIWTKLLHSFFNRTSASSEGRVTNLPISSWPSLGFALGFRLGFGLRRSLGLRRASRPGRSCGLFGLRFKWLGGSSDFRFLPLVDTDCARVETRLSNVLVGGLCSRQQLKSKLPYFEWSPPWHSDICCHMFLTYHVYIWYIYIYNYTYI